MPTDMHQNNPSMSHSNLMKGHAALMDLVPKNKATHVAIKSGSWFNPNVWRNGKIPDDGANVVVDQGVNLRYDNQSDARLKTVRLDGTLTFAENRDTKMVVDTFVESHTGTLNIGTAARPIQADKTAQIVFANTGKINRNWDPQLLSRGLVTHGKVNVHGAQKTEFTQIQDVRAGASELVLSGVPRGWRVGDTLVVGGTQYNENGTDRNNSRFQDETLTITSISGNRVRFTNDDIKSGNNKVLRFDHVRPDIAEKSQLNLYVANTSRNVTFETENAASVPTQQRGHVMFMHNPNVNVQNAGFYNLGRSDKTLLVDDPGRNMGGSSGSGNNARGRYPVHFHRMGADDITSTPAFAKGNAVVGSPGWGIAHHDSHVVLENNVVFDVAGAGIAAESGNEIGAWRNNLTLKTKGTGRYVRSSDVKAREKRFDLGFQGEGYWVQGAAQVAMEDNIAISANSSGITVFGDTLTNSDPRDAKSIAVKSLPERIRKLFPAGQQRVDITDVPLRQLSGFESYNTKSGINVWAHLSNFDGQLSLDNRTPNATHGGRSTIDNFTLWGNRSTGIRTDYSSSIDYVDGLIVGDAAKPIAGATGIIQNAATRKNRYQNLTVRGFEEGAVLSFPGEGKEKDFTASSIENSRFENNKYNLTKIGNDRIIEGRPDDFSGLLKIANTSFGKVAGNAAPTASFTQQAAGGLSVTFDGSNSADSDPLRPDGERPRYSLASQGIASYAWDFNQDGKFDAYGREVTHAFKQRGNQRVTLQVMDNQGETTRINQQVNVQPTAYTNPFENGRFDRSAISQARFASSTATHEGWKATTGVRWSNGTAVVSNTRDKSSAIAQVIQNNQLHKGRQSLSFRLKNVEGSRQASDRNEVSVQLWGVNGEFENSLQAANGPVQAGSLPMNAKMLFEEDFNGSSFDWRNFNESVDLGNGYQFLLFQVSTEDTGNRGDIVAIDNVSLSTTTPTTPPTTPEPPEPPTTPTPPTPPEPPTTPTPPEPPTTPTPPAPPEPPTVPGPAPTKAIRVEAEDMRLSGEYRVESIKAASGGKAISLRGGAVEGTGEAYYNFNGPSGLYKVTLEYFDENDGIAKLNLSQGDNTIGNMSLNRQLGSRSADEQTLTRRNFRNVYLEKGKRFTIAAQEDGTASTAEHARVDAIQFTPEKQSRSSSAAITAAVSADMVAEGSSLQASLQDNILQGGPGADTFTLGSDFISDVEQQIAQGYSGAYTLIKDFDAEAGDRIDLSPAYDYRLGTSQADAPNGTGIFASFDKGEGLVAVVENVSTLQT